MMTGESINGDIRETQEKLMVVILKITSLNGVFSQVGSEQEMESLNSEIRQHLKEMRSLIGQLKNYHANGMISEQDLTNDVDTITHLTQEFKDANLKAIQRLQRQNHEFLLQQSNNSNNSSLIKKGDPKINLISESSGVTDKLSTLSRQLARTVEKSRCTLDELAESSEKVGETGEELKGMASLLGQSRKLITKYGRREITDRVLIIFAIAFFFAVVFYILRKRVFGPLDPISLIWTLTNSLLSLLGLIE